MISKLLRLYKRSHGLRQICNVCVYITHSACTIHLLNLPEKNAKRDIIHGVKHLEEMSEGWLCARRTLGILSVLAKRWEVELPEEAQSVLARTDSKFGPWQDISTPKPSYREPALSIDPLPSPTENASPSLQPYTVSVPNVTTPQYVTRGPHASNMTVSNSPHIYSPPPNDPNILAYTRTQHHATPQSSAALNPATPASTNARQSIDGQSTAGNSPSQLFGGVDQLIREGQDWIFRDQTQLASGFGNWVTPNIDDMAGWFAAQSPTQGVVGVQGGGAQMNGGPVGGGNGNGSGFGGQAGGASVSPNGGSAFGSMSGLQGFQYDEGSWYDYR